MISKHNPHYRWFIISLLLTMGLLPGFASDNFIPSLPAIAHDLSISAALAKMTMSIYLAGLFISQLIYGPLSDKFGRRIIMFIGLGIFAIGTLYCLFAPTISHLLIGRLIQGLGAGASAVLFRAILRDCFDGVELAKTGAYLSIAFAIIPAVAPISGGYVQQFFGWRYNFGICAIFLIFIAAYLFFCLPETLPHEKRHSRSFMSILKTYGAILSHWTFLRNTACSGLAFASLMVFLTLSPFLFQQVLGLTPVQYGWLLPLTAASFLVGGFINTQLMHSMSLHQIMRIAVIVMLLAAMVMLVLGLFHILTVWAVLLPMLGILATHAFIFANSFAGAFQPFPHAAGMVAALYASLQMLFGSVATSIAALLPTHSQNSLACLMVCLAALLNCLLLKRVVDWGK